MNNRMVGLIKRSFLSGGDYRSGSNAYPHMSIVPLRVPDDEHRNGCYIQEDFGHRPTRRIYEEVAGVDVGWWYELEHITFLKVKEIL